MAILTSGTSTCGSMEQVASSFSARHCVYLKSLSSQRQHQRPRCFRYSCDKLSKLGTSGGSPRMILNGYVGRDTYRMKKDNDEKIYRRLDSCLVIPPPKGKKPKAIIKFLGGAFIGAVPEVTYGSVVLPVFILFPLFYLLGLLANEGYLIISVPYNVTFDHSQAAREVFERFYSCLNSVLTYGLPSDGLLAAELVDLPLYSVGHSNGALLQVLGGSYFSDKLPKLGPLVSQMMPMVEASHVSSMAKSVADAWKTLLDTAEAMTPDYDPETRVSLDKFFDQLPSVFNQVAQGISEFKPTPTENRECCKNSYNVPKTLLVKFNTDAIDETDLLEETLRPRVEAIGGTLDIVSLSGNHITPCIQDPKLQVGDIYTPADAIAQGLKTLSLNETKTLARTIVELYDQLLEEYQDIVKAASQPLFYKSLEELKEVLSIGLYINNYKTVEHEHALDDENLSYNNLHWMKGRKKRSNLLKWFKKEHKLLDNGQEGYTVDNNGKKSVMFSARGAIRSVNLSFESSPESRFGEVAVINQFRFEIKKKIKSNVLSLETAYAIYLIYKLPQDQSKFNSLLEITNCERRVHEDWFETLTFEIAVMVPIFKFGLQITSFMNSATSWLDIVSLSSNHITPCIQ
ncbi:alpha/beta hydrolase fold protein, partial [Tanacetum coccineum]